MRLQSLDADLGLSRYAKSSCLVGQNPCVEISKCLCAWAGGLEGAGDVDNRKTSLGLWHLVDGKRCVWELVLEVHGNLETVDSGRDRVISLNPGIDTNGHNVLLGVEDPNGVDVKLGMVDLVLDDLWDGNKDPMRCQLALLDTGV